MFLIAMLFILSLSLSLSLSHCSYKERLSLRVTGATPPLWVSPPTSFLTAISGQ